MASRFKSIYEALSFFTSVVIPPLIVVVFFGMMTRKFNSKCAIVTLLLGLTAVVVSTKFPILIKPISHGVDISGGYSYMRSLFGLLVSAIIALVMIGAVGGEDKPSIDGMTVDSLDTAFFTFKGWKTKFQEGR